MATHIELLKQPGLTKIGIKQIGWTVNDIDEQLEAAEEEVQRSLWNGEDKYVCIGKTDVRNDTTVSLVVMPDYLKKISIPGYTGKWRHVVNDEVEMYGERWGMAVVRRYGRKAKPVLGEKAQREDFNIFMRDYDDIIRAYPEDMEVYRRTNKNPDWKPNRIPDQDYLIHMGVAKYDMLLKFTTALVDGRPYINAVLGNDWQKAQSNVLRSAIRRIFANG